MTKKQIELVGSITETRKLKAGEYFSEARKIANEVGFVGEVIFRDFRTDYRTSQTQGKVRVHFRL